MLIILYYMAEETRRVDAGIDKKLYENVVKLGYTISEAITLGFERLLEDSGEETAPTEEITRIRKFIEYRARGCPGGAGRKS
jgi:hypothetical protein